MNAVTGSLIDVLLIALRLYIWALIISAIMSWLIAFNVINPYNKFVSIVGDFLYRITEPALRPIRKVVPIMGGMDLSPLVLIFILWFVQGILIRLSYGGF